MLVALLRELGQQAQSCPPVELTLVGGSAGMLTGQLPVERTTIDFDVIRTEPEQGMIWLRPLAAELAREWGLPEDWFSDQVAALDVLPSGWRKRRVLAGQFGNLCVWCVGRLDLLSMKAYAGRMQDRADLRDMKPSF